MIIRLTSHSWEREILQLKTYENVHEFIDRILIHELDKEINTWKIEIMYSFVGRVETGDQPTESMRRRG